MEKTGRRAHSFGLVGRNISYSFSKGYFTQKFKDLGLEDHSYENFDLEKISDLKQLIDQRPDLKGLNVTIPYKEEIIPYLDEIHPVAKEIGAVNTIKFNAKGLEGYNTDVHGFEKAIKPLLESHHKRALILGTGGASKAIAFVLKGMEIPFSFVSRKPHRGQLCYSDLDKSVMQESTILINCTPLGTLPAITKKPSIPYEHLTDQHLLFDLIYNPEKTSFLLEGEGRGASICNGLAMLQFQAEKSWEIWNSDKSIS